jgi:hypothetical protein
MPFEKMFQLYRASLKCEGRRGSKQVQERIVAKNRLESGKRLTSPHMASPVNEARINQQGPFQHDKSPPPELLKATFTRCGDPATRRAVYFTSNTTPEPLHWCPTRRVYVFGSYPDGRN